MAVDGKTKSLGQAIDEIINALAGVNEKDKLVAINAACSHLSIKYALSENIPIARTTAAPASVPLQKEAQNVVSPNVQNSSHIGDIRSLKEEKNPASAREMACIVAYYLQTSAPANEQKEEISIADIKKYFKQAGFPLPKAIEKVLQDAKSGGYFDSASRGLFKLNPVGYNLVVHGLPRDSQGRRSAVKRKAAKGKKSKR